MIRYILFSICLFLTHNIFSQETNMSEYSYVIIPEQFEFLNAKDQYQINSMTKFYFEKYGFNAYMADTAPNANRCDGLFANVEQLTSIFGTKLQLVIKDCNDVEIYRGNEGKSKFKEHDKTYQDALRKAFTGLQALNVKQKDVELLKGKEIAEKNTPNKKVISSSTSNSNLVTNAGFLPESKFSNYTNSGKSFLLRKTTEGYSLYKESSTTEDGLELLGKIIVMDKVIKYMDIAGNVSDASFDSDGNLSVGNSEKTRYLLQD